MQEYCSLSRVTDRFEEVTGKLARIGISKIPVAGLFVQIVEAIVPPSADARLRAAVAADVEETVVRLQSRVERLEKELEAQGKKLDELGAARTVSLAKDFASATSGVASNEKIEALINAAAHQFDPRLRMRPYWYAVVRDLSDPQIALIRWLDQYKTVAMSTAEPATAIGGTRSGIHTKLELPAADVVAMYTVGAASEGLEGLFHRKALALSGKGMVEFELSPRGLAVASFIKD